MIEESLSVANSNDDEGIAVGYDEDDDRGNGVTNGVGGDGGGDGRRNTGGYVYGNLRIAGLPERDIGDYDAIADDDELRDVENRCMGEMILNCSRFRSALEQQGVELKHTYKKTDFKKVMRSCFSMDALRERVPIVAWAPKYRCVLCNFIVNADHPDSSIYRSPPRWQVNTF